MTDSNSFETIAEVAITLAGFTGIVAVLGRRARGDWSAIELLQLRALLQWSLGVVFLAYLPSALTLLGIETAKLWRISLGIFATFHLFVFLWFFSAYWALPAEERAHQQFLAVAVPVGFGVLAAEILGASGFLLQSAPFIFLLALLWFIGIAASNFVFLLLPRDARPAAQQADEADVE